MMKRLASLRSVITLVSLLAGFLAAQHARAQGIAFAGTSSDGLAVVGQMDFGDSVTASLEETLADGSLHRRFELAPDPAPELPGGWRVRVGGTALFSASDEYYEHGDLGGPQVDVYLRQDGRSALSLDWTLYPACHGGCLHTARIQLDLQSDTDSLFASAIYAGVFARYDHGAGWVSDLYEVNGPFGNDHRESRFTLAAVPEPGAAPMALAGLTLALGVAFTRTSGARRWGSPR